MRVLHLVNDYGDLGNGIVNLCANLAMEQSKSHEVAVASRDGDYVTLSQSMGISFFELDFNRKSIRGLASLVRSMRSLWKSFDPQVVHAHTMTSAVAVRALMSIGLVARVPLVTTVHNEYQRGASLMWVGDRVVFVTSAGLENSGLARYRASRARVVNNGPVDGQLSHEKRRAGTRDGSETGSNEPGPLRIVSLGAVCERKGSDVLLAAFHKASASGANLELHFVGNVDWPEVRLRAESNSGFQNRVIFHGLQRDVQMHLRPASSTVLVQMSRREPFGLALCEGMVAGVPIIGSEVDGIPEVLDFGRAGILLASGDVDALAATLISFYEDTQLRERYAVASSVRASHFRTSRMSAEYVDVYRDALVNRVRPLARRSK